MKAARPLPVKSWNVGVDAMDRTLVYLAINGQVFTLHARDAKTIFDAGVKTVSELCGAHALEKTT